MVRADKAIIVGGVWLLALFAAVAYKSGPAAATWFVACCVVGYLNAFYVFRSLLIVVRGQRVGIRSWVVAAASSIASGAIICFGSSGDTAVLILATLGFIWIDALVLRFR